MRTLVLAQLFSAGIEQSMQPLRGLGTCELLHHFKLLRVILWPITVLMLPDDRCTLYNSERVSHPSVVISPRWIFIAKTVHDQLDRSRL